MDRRQFMVKTLAALAAATSAPLTNSSTYNQDKKGLYVDGLSFLPDDLGDIKASKLDGFIADISDYEEVKRPDGTIGYKRTYNACIKSIKEAYDIVKNPANNLVLAHNGRSIEKARQDDKVAVFFQIQGAECIEDDIHLLDDFIEYGLHVLQLTHHNGNRFSGGALDNDQTGLSEDGENLISFLNDKNILIDVSHSSPQSALEAVKISKGPIIQSHGSARALVNHARCSPDEVIKAIADSGGIFGIFMMSFWLTLEAEPKPAHYLDHLRHVINIGGIDSAAIANDFPMRGQLNLLKLGNNNQEGVKQYLSWWNSQAAKGILGFDHIPEHVVIPEFNNIHRMERIDTLLQRGGYSSVQRDKIMGLNLARVL